jgi:ABC-type proline/glycine betaine transport system ATPase subunit
VIEIQHDGFSRISLETARYAAKGLTGLDLDPFEPVPLKLGVNPPLRCSGALRMHHCVFTGNPTRLDRPTAGRIEIGDRPVFDSDEDIFVDAQFRNLGLMFQSYALWPHMTVADNLAFPLGLRSIKGRDARDRIDETLELVDMTAYRHRNPGELSGGQQQRVALARTLVYQPRILLLDEPLSNLDAKLRDRARVWLRDLQRRTGVTTVYVTHDQTEALSLSDRIVVMNGGSVAQIGTPREIYDTPSDVFVADFVGSTNLLNAELIERTETVRRGSPEWRGHSGRFTVAGWRIEWRGGRVDPARTHRDPGSRMPRTERPERTGSQRGISRRSQRRCC